MGQSISAALEQKQNETEKQLAADMQNLSTILEAKQNEYYAKLVNSKGEDKTIPIKTLVEYKKHMSVNVSTEPSHELTSAVEELFGGNFMSSLKALTLGAINTVLGHGSAGQKEDSGYKILIINSAVVRVDYYVYGYNLHTTGVVDRTRSGLVFVATIGTVDLKAVGLEVLVYLVGKQATESMLYLRQRTDVWKTRLTELNDLTPEAAEAGKTTITKAVLEGWYTVLKDESIAKEANDATTTPGKVTLVDTWAGYKEAVTKPMTTANEQRDNLLRALPDEQNRILDEMVRIFTKAREVSSAISGLTANRRA